MIVNAAIIGSGQAGPPLATALAADGELVVLFEAEQLGGTCVNTGCTPTTTLRKSARGAHQRFPARVARASGPPADTGWQLHWPRIRADFPSAGFILLAPITKTDLSSQGRYSGSHLCC